MRLNYMAPAPGIRGSVMNRTLPCTSGGSCFLMDRDDKRYVVTAHHVVAGIEDSQVLKILTANGYEDIGVRVVGIDEQKDIAVLAPMHEDLQTRLPNLDYGLHGVVMGQEVFCAGFPQISQSSTPGGNMPMPVVTRGCFSGAKFADDKDTFLIGVHAAAGMSGGPLAFQNVQTGKWTVMGITSAALLEPRKFEDGSCIKWPSGFTLGRSMSVAENLIDQNPLGHAIAA